MLILINHCLFSMCAVSRRVCSMILPGTEVRLASYSAPRLPFLPFCKWGLCFPFFSHWELPQMTMTSQWMESGLVTSSDSTLRTYGCILSVPMDLCTFTFLGWSQASFPIAGGPLFCQSLLFSSLVTWVECLEHFLVKIVKNIIEHISFPYPWKPALLFPLERAHVFPSLSLITNVPTKALPVGLEWVISCCNKDLTPCGCKRCIVWVDV